MSRLKKDCLPGLLLMITGGMAVGLFRAFRANRAAMTALAEHFAMPYKRAVSAVMDLLPFSGAELLCAVAAAAVIAYLFKILKNRKKGGRGLIGALALLAGLGIWVYAGVCALWGVHYYTAGFAEQAGMEARSVSPEELTLTCLYFREQANEASLHVKRDEAGRFDYTWQEIFANSKDLYSGICEEYPFLQGPERRPKPDVISVVMSMANFTGYIFPLLGETNLNVDAPAVFLPVTIAHEFSHQRAVAAELEANYVGIEACLASEKPEYIYSGWLFGYLHLTNALYETAPELYYAVEEGLNEYCKADMQVNNEYWAQYPDKKPVAKVMNYTYESFLAGYDQYMGIRSYGACVDLLNAKYLSEEYAGRFLLQWAEREGLA